MGYNFIIRKKEDKIPSNFLFWTLIGSFLTTIILMVINFISIGWDGFHYQEFVTEGIIPIYVILIFGALTLTLLFSIGNQKTNHGKMNYENGRFKIKFGPTEYEFSDNQITKIDADIFENKFSETDRLMITFYGIEQTGLTVYISHHNSKVIWGNYFKLMGELKSKGINVEFKETAI